MFSNFLQDPMSPLIFFISSFHDHTILVIIIVLSTVMYIFISIIIIPSFGRFFNSSESLEGLWTIIPCLILISLAAPSLITLYISDDVSSPVTSINVIGHQWYWSYEYEGESGISFDSYLIPSNDLDGGFRLLDVDNSIFLPYGSEVRFIISSSDVIHSWCIPSIGIKIDAVPGRLNQIYSIPNNLGIIFGQWIEPGSVAINPFHLHFITTHIWIGITFRLFSQYRCPWGQLSRGGDGEQD